MKTFLRLSAFLCTFVGFINFLNAQSCPTTVERTCAATSNTAQFDLDMSDCVNTPDPGQVNYEQGVSDYNYSSQPSCVDGSPTAVSYNSATQGCDIREPFTIIFNFTKNGGNSSVSCEYEAGNPGSPTPTGTASSSLAVLPVELVYFTSDLREATVYLHWQTASEINNEGFSLERSVDGKEWTTLDFIKGNGTSIDFNSYDYTDENPIKGETNYYRLRQLDFDGQENVTRVTSEFMVGKGAGQINVFPNPVSNGEINVEFHFEDSNETIVRLVDALGRTILTKEISVADKGQRDVLNLSEVSKGNYYLIVQTAFQTYHKQILIQ